MGIDNEKAIRAVVASYVEAYASGFSDRHLSEVNDEEGTINMKIRNVFIAALGADIQYYSALARSLDSSLGNMLEKMAIQIAKLHYEVSQHVEGNIYQEQTDYITELLELYKNTKGDGHVLLSLFEGKVPYGEAFWNWVCKSDNGYDIVFDELNRNSRTLAIIIEEYKRKAA